MTLEYINQELQTLKERKNYRSLPPLIHEGRDVLLNGQRMLNLSSNDYLGLLPGILNRSIQSFPSRKRRSKPCC